MVHRKNPKGASFRPAVAATELAILLPFLASIFLMAVDYSRLFYSYVTVTDCARNGALYGMIDNNHAQDTSGIQNAALADASNLNPQPTVGSATGTDANGNPYVEVTVTYKFQTIANYPGIPSLVSVSRKVRTEVVPP
jgi:Flp pilus assembly protein TadG